MRARTRTHSPVHASLVFLEVLLFLTRSGEHQAFEDDGTRIRPFWASRRSETFGLGSTFTGRREVDLDVLDFFRRSSRLGFEEPPSMLSISSATMRPWCVALIRSPAILETRAFVHEHYARLQDHLEVSSTKKSRRSPRDRDQHLDRSRT